MIAPSNAFTLTVRQQPERARVFNGAQTREKGRSTYVDAQKIGSMLADTHPDRKPIDPPPIVQLQITDPTDPAQYVNPHLFEQYELNESETISKAHTSLCVVVCLMQI